MKDFDFDKHFADKMRQAGAPDHSEEDWERLLPKLDAVQQKRWRAFPLWWLGLLSGLLLCSNIGWWWMWQQSEQRTDHFQSTLLQMGKAGLTLHDTTWKKVVVYQYDTVYQTMVYRTTTGNATTNAELVLGEGDTNDAFAGNTTNAVIPAAPTPQNQSLTQNSPLALDTLERTQEALHLTDPLNSLELSLDLLPMPERKLNPKGIEIAKTPKKHKKYAFLLVPRQLRIGAGGGCVIPVAPHLNNAFGYTTYLTAEVAFSDRLAMTFDGGYTGLLFKATEYDENLGLPPEVSPGDEYKLKYLEMEEGSKPILQFNAGMRYWLHASKKMSPYLGLGFGMQWHPAYELHSEYVHQLTGNLLESAIEVPALADPVPILDLNAGLRFRLLQKWYWQSGAFYQFKIDASKPGIPHFWGLKSSVLFDF